ncbi:hypothetical protein JXB31_05535 [Candidatus Woesearchaeota archaeon]|nr:hypothetical protein [Candidatus Woesearchaeota archaeon]
MGILLRLKNWQKGFVFGFGLTTLLCISYSLVLIYLDIRLERLGLPHMCFSFTQSVFCTFEEAIYTRLGFIIVLVMVFSIPSGVMGALIGYIIDRIGVGN